jgi:hypothetical protein
MAPIRLIIAFLLAMGGAAAARAAGSGSADDGRKKAGELVILSRTPCEDPADALFAAAELARVGGAFYDSLFARGLETDAAMRAATIDGAERAARAVVRRLVLRSGGGLPLASSGFARKEYERLKAAGAGGIGAGARDLVDGRLRALARAAGLAEPPKGLSPVYAPTFTPAAPKGAVETTIGSGALGFGLLAEVRLAARLAGSRRTDAGGPVGETPEAGFEGLLLLYCASAELHALRSLFAYDGSAFAPAVLVGDYDPFSQPRYFPRTLLVRGDPGGAGEPALAAKDRAERLGDAAAMLLGAAEYARFATGEGASLFGVLKAGDVREEIFPAALAPLAKDLVRFLFRNIAALHFDPTPGRLAFVAEAFPGAKGTRVTTADAALAVLALEAAIETFPDDARLKAEAKKLIESQARFFLARMTADGALPAAVDFGAKEAGVEDPPDLAGEALAVQALSAAARVSGDEKIAAGAARLMRSIERRRWDPWVELYLGAPGAEFTVGPRDGPAVIGALRELATAGSARALVRLRTVVAALARAGALPDEDGVPAEVRVGVKRGS